MARERRTEIILVVSIVLLGAFIARFLYIPPYPDRQVAVAERRLGMDVGDPSRWLSAWSVGDGQAYAVIAIDPTGAKLGEEIKEPLYRFSRAGYGWLGWAFSLGRESLVPLGLALAGAVAVLSLLALAIALRDRLGPNSWWLVLNPAVYLAFAGDTSESWGALLLALALATGSVLGAVALGVTRPTYLLGLFGRWRLLLAGLIAGAALAAYGLWQFGQEGSKTSGGRIGFPLVAYIQNPSIAGWALVAAATVTLILGLRQKDWTWVLAAIFVFAFGNGVTLNPINAWRAAGLLPVLWAFRPGYQPPIVRRSAARPSGRPIPGSS